MTAGAAGLDVRACLEGDPMPGVDLQAVDLQAVGLQNGAVVLAPGQRLAVPTGLAMAVPVGFEIQVRPRSGLARQYGVTVANAPGTIDADYRGEVMVLLVNLGADPVRIQHGDRIAQLVVAPVVLAEPEEVEALPETARASGGFGSTGR